MYREGRGGPCWETFYSYPFLPCWNHEISPSVAVNPWNSCINDFFCFVFYMHRKGFCAEISKETARLSPEFYSYTSCRRASRTSAIFGHSLGSYGRGRVNKRSPPRLATPRRASGSDSVPFRKPLRNLKMNYFLFVAGHERAYRNRNLTAFAYGNTVDVIVQMRAILI